MLDKIVQLWAQIQSDKKKIGLVMIIFFFLAYGDFAYILKAQIKGVGILGNKIAQLKNEIKVFQKDLALMQQSKGRKETDAPKAQRLIMEGEIPILLEEVYGLANKNGVKIMQAKPVKDAKVKESIPKQLGNVSPLLLALELFSGYHNLGSFLSDLESAKIYLAVDEIKIVGDTQDYFQQQINLALKTYVKK